MDNIALGYETILNTNVGLNWELVEDLVAPIVELDWVSGPLSS